VRIPAFVPRLVLLVLGSVVLACGGGGGGDTASVSTSAPVAAFSATPATGPAPLAVAFTDTSTGSITSRSWTFGDGATSAEANPSHTFTAAGSYTVALTVKGAGGSNTKTQAGCVVVGSSDTPAPVAAFSATPTTGTAPLTVTFTDASTGSITSCSWTFGDGSTSTESNPSHTFTVAGSYSVALTVTGPGGSNTKTQAACVVVGGGSTTSAWRFAMVGDTHVQSTVYAIPTELVSAMLADAPSLVLVAGDIVDGGKDVGSSAALKTQLQLFQTVMSPLTSAGIPVYPIRGNHEDDAVKSGDDTVTWNEVFSGVSVLPANGPSGEANLTYSFNKNNAIFIGLDDYVNIHRVNQTWLDAQFLANTNPHVFVFGHEAAFRARHDDCLDDYVTERDTFWKSLSGAGAKVYLCGHDHFFDLARIDDGDGDTSNDLLQCIVGTGGGDLFTEYSYIGENSTFSPVNVAHENEYGYLLVEISGTGSMDLGVTLTWKMRTLDSATGTYSYVPAHTYSYTAASKVKYPVVDSGQVLCYNTSTAITAPAVGADFYGQDAQHTGIQPSYRDNGDGTVSDLNTGLMWVKARGSQLTWALASSGVSSCTVGGYSDWRMPTIKELYSLILYTGVQGTSMSSTDGYIPFIDSTVFDFVYGTTGSTTTGSRVIDCQDWSSTTYVGTTMVNSATAFGLNFADGRIKGYPQTSTNYVRYVRGNSKYGVNEFKDNGDGTITDGATRLMWAQADSGVGMDWEAALAWAQAKNPEGYLGHTDWRLPNAKEMQSIVDYSRAPKATDVTKQGPAIDPIFGITAITNEGGETDYPFYWVSTTFFDGTKDGAPAAYVTFGRALGYMKLNGSTTYQLLDVHGAGAQRSDPKAGSVTDYLLGTDASGNPVYGRGPQGDVVRINNFVRLVRDAD